LCDQGDMDAAGKTLNGEKLKLVEELDWRCERFVKSLAELSTNAQKVRGVLLWGMVFVVLVAMAL